MRAHVVGWTERATGDASVEPGGFASADETRPVSVVVVSRCLMLYLCSVFARAHRSQNDPEPLSNRARHTREKISIPLTIA